jgi:hypothetical protein
VPGAGDDAVVALAVGEEAAVDEPEFDAAAAATACAGLPVAVGRYRHTIRPVPQSSQDPSPLSRYSLTRHPSGCSSGSGVVAAAAAQVPLLPALELGPLGEPYAPLDVGLAGAFAAAGDDGLAMLRGGDDGDPPGL